MIRVIGEHDVEWVLPLLKICFNAENPNVYVERIHNTVEIIEWSQVVCASDTTIKEASLSQGPCPRSPIKDWWDSTPGSSGPQG